MPIIYVLLHVKADKLVLFVKHTFLELCIKIALYEVYNRLVVVLRTMLRLVVLVCFKSKPLELLEIKQRKKL